MYHQNHADIILWLLLCIGIITYMIYALNVICTLVHEALT